MRMKQLGPVLIMTLGLLQFGPATAISLNIFPVNQTVNLNDSFSVDVVVSGLDASSEIVSAYDLDLTYDSSLLMATDVQFGTDLGDEFFFEVFNGFSLATAGVVDFAQLSILSDPVLDAMQGDSVLLATMSFDAIGVGLSSLMLDSDVIGLNATILGLTLSPGSVRVIDVAVIPLPGAALLMLTGLLGIGVASRKRS
jgi:hypothetical protein